MKRQTIGCHVAAFILGIALTHFASAAEIGSTAFSDSAVIQRFDDLGYPLQNIGPVMIGPDIYSTLYGGFRYRADWGALMGRTGGGIGTDVEGDYLEIQLGTPALRAGLYAGTIFRGGRTDVSFYGENDALLGTIPLLTGPDQSQFAGWEADVGRISKIRVFDVDQSNFIIATVDDFIQEVPEPATMSLLPVGAMTLASCCTPRRSVRDRPA